MKKLVSRVTAFCVFAGLFGLSAQSLVHAAPLPSWSPLPQEPLRDAVATRASQRASVRVIGLSVPTEGIVRLLAIPVQFLRDTDPLTSGNGTFPYRTWGPASGTNYLSSRLQRLKNYYDEVSGGHVQLMTHLESVVTLPYAMGSYAADLAPTVTDVTLRTRMMQDVVDRAATNIRFDDYDMIMLIHAGSAGELSVTTGTLDLPTSHIVAPKGAEIQTNNGVAIGAWSLVPETLCNDSIFSMANPTVNLTTYEATPPQTLPDPNVFTPHYWDVVGSWAHEVGHAFGMADVYDTTYSGGITLGKWSLMAEGAYTPNPETVYPNQSPWTIAEAGESQDQWFGSTPTHPDAWNRMLVGWASVINVEGQMPSQVLTPQSLTSTGLVYRMARDGDQTRREYYLAEVRAKADFDTNIPETGLVVYHVDDTIGTIAANDLEVDYVHPRIRPVPSGNSLTDQVVSVAPYKHFYVADKTVVFPGPSTVTVFGPNTTPSSADYSGTDTGIEIANIALNGTAVTADFRTGRTSGSVTFTDPPSYTTFYVTEPTLKAELVNVDIDTVTVTLDNSSLSTAQYTTSLLTTTPRVAYELVVRPTALIAGRHTLTVSARDAQGIEAVSDTLDFSLSTRTLPQAEHMMFSLPANNLPVAGQVFSPPIAPDRLAWWNPFKAGTNKYEFPSSTLYDWTVAESLLLTRDMTTDTVVTPAGRGFWGQIPQFCTLNLSGNQTSSAHKYAVPVFKGLEGSSYGFNMIGNPYAFPVPFSSLQVDLNGDTCTVAEAVRRHWLDPVLYTWVTPVSTLSGAQPGYIALLLGANPSIEPWTGYWMVARAGSLDHPLHLIFQPGQTPGRAVIPEVRTVPTPSAWELAITANDTTGAGGAKTVIGVSRDASAAVDPAVDLVAPPSAPAGISVTSRVGETALYRDLRAALTPMGQTSWQLDVSGQAGSAVLVTWPDMTEVPTGVSLLIRDSVTGQERYMRSTTSLRVDFGPTETSRVIVVTASAIPVDGLTLTTVRAQATTQTVQISGVVNMPAAIVCAIRTPQGALVKRLETNVVVAGAFSLAWDGHTERGSLAPRGIYQCDVIATGADGQTVRRATLLQF
jgi:M6 family metalloprotease-like protein